MKMLNKLQKIMEKVRKASVVDKDLINEVSREIQRILIQSDVSVPLVKQLTDKIKEKAEAQELPKGVSRKEHLTKIIYNELKQILGGERYAPRMEGHDILLVGLYGHGKTTTTAKLAHYYSKRGLKTAMITTDTYRPAAHEQLQQLSKKINADAYGYPDESKAQKALQKALKETEDYDMRIIDSAGRDNVNEELLKEIKDIKNTLDPQETFLILSADIGQTAKDIAKTFNEQIGLTGIITTKTDTSAKAGGTLTACREADVPVAFIGTGEKTEDFKTFNAEDFVSQLLGQPDLGELLKRVKRATEETDLSIEELMKKDYNLKVFYKQLGAMNSMGSMTKIMNMLGLSKKIPEEELKTTQEKMEKYKYILDSMTDEELQEPKKINQSRKQRIAKGAGVTESDVNELIKHFNKSKKMIKRMQQGKMREMKGVMKKMQGKGLF